MFPLSAVLFPHAPLPLHVFEPRYQALVGDCLDGDGDLGVVLISRGSEVGGGDERFEVGTVAHIELASPMPGGRWSLVTTGRQRIRVTQWLPDRPYPYAEVEALPPTAGPGGTEGAPEVTAGLDAAVAAVRRARALLSEAGQVPALSADVSLDADPEVATWQVCALAPLTPYDAQRLLEIDDHRTRLAEVASLSAALADDLSRLLSGGA